MERVEDLDGPLANHHERELHNEIRHLKQLLGAKTREVDFFKDALQKVEA